MIASLAKVTGRNGLTRLVRVGEAIREALTGEVELTARATAEAMRAGGAAALDDIKSKTASAGLGNLRHAWKLRAYPPAPQGSLRAAAFVHAGDRALEAFDVAGAANPIAPVRSRYLVIPTAAGRLAGLTPRLLRPLERAGTPQPVRAMLERRKIAVRFAPIGSGKLAMIAERVAESGKKRVRLRQYKRRGQTMVLATLVPSVTIRKRLDVARSADAGYRAVIASLNQSLVGGAP